MSVMTEERQQSQLELEGLKRTLEWTEIQQEQLLDRLDMLRLDNARLQDRVEELQDCINEPTWVIGAVVAGDKRVRLV